jgi:uncharacterized membrane protein YbaN (DUF454 family)
MAGTARIVLGVIFVIIGLLTLIILVGLIPLTIGVLLIAWGLDARKRERIEQWLEQAMAQQTQLLQQMTWILSSQSHSPTIVTASPVSLSPHQGTVSDAPHEPTS